MRSAPRVILELLAVVVCVAGLPFALVWGVGAEIRLRVETKRRRRRMFLDTVGRMTELDYIIHNMSGTPRC
jgi:hypothetical protein